MSYGTMCLTCRHYVTPATRAANEWDCKCAHPIPSNDGVNPLKPTTPAGPQAMEGE